MDFDKMIAFAKSAKVDYAHSFDHVSRVFHSAMRIAEGHPEADKDALKAAVILHDIGRSDLTVAHAKMGAVMAKQWLIQNGYGEEFAGKVARVISSHSDRDEARQAGIEGEILWDADKLEMTGVIGMLRAMLYCEETDLPMTAVAPQFTEDQTIAEKGFHTKEAVELAKERLAFGKKLIDELKNELPGEVKQ